MVRSQVAKHKLCDGVGVPYRDRAIPTKHVIRWYRCDARADKNMLDRLRTATFGHSCLKKTRVGNDRSQSTTDVARRRNRNEKLYKAGARSSVTLAAQNANQMAAVSEIELAPSTLNGRTCP